MTTTGPDEDADVDGLVVGQVAGRLGVTVRTLHHWDEVRLASPSQRTRAGYRLYTAADLARLQRVVVYRELDLPLETIRTLLDEHDPTAALQEQRTQVVERIARLRELATGLDRMIAAHERGVLLTVEQQAAIFGDDWDPAWVEQARQRWGRTEQWAQYAERAAGRTPAEWGTIASASAELEDELAQALADGAAPGGMRANRLAERHREVLSAYFPVSQEMQVCLGRMYEADPSFTAHYEKVRPGLTAWLRRVIDENARANGVDPDAATWR